MAHTLISVLERQGQVHLCKFEACLVYIVSTKTAKAVWKDSCPPQNKQANKQKIKHNQTKAYNPKENL